MHDLLEFYKALIVFTAGTAITILWITLIILASVEIYDRITETSKEDAS